MNKKKSLIVFAIVGVALISFCGWYFGLKVPHDKAFETYKAVVADYDEKAVSYNDAVNFYNSAEEKIESANRELDEAISEAQELISNPKLNDRETTVYEKEFIDGFNGICAFSWHDFHNSLLGQGI